MNSIKIKNLNFNYANQIVLKDINLNYDQEDFLAIIGPNGGGKSTLLKLILGLLTPNSGEIKIYNKSVKENAIKLSYVPQNTNLNPNFPMMVIDVVLMGKLDNKYFGFYSKQDRHEALLALEEVGIKDLATRRIDQLSGGQRQRAFIARCLCAKSKILILDEPTASIDVDGQGQIFNLLKDIHIKNKLGIIMVSHDTNIIFSYANKIAHINKKLFMHDISNLHTNESIINTIKNKNNHICQVELMAEVLKQKL